MADNTYTYLFVTKRIHLWAMWGTLVHIVRVCAVLWSLMLLMLLMYHNGSTETNYPTHTTIPPTPLCSEVHGHCQHRVSFMLKITLALNWRIGFVFCKIKIPKIGHRSERKIDWEELRNVTDYRLQQSSIDLHKLTIYRLDQWQCPAPQLTVG